MLTKARIAGHPIHPMLVAFPIGLYTITFVALVVFAASKLAFWYHVATLAAIAGPVMALGAALFGFIDFLALPTKSRAQKTALKHMALNVTALLLFVITAVILANNWWGTVVSLSWVAPLVLSAIGVGITVGAGLFGWTLVQTHHVGIKPTTHAAVAQNAEDIDDLDELVAPPHPVAVVETHEVIRH